MKTQKLFLLITGLIVLNYHTAVSNTIEVKSEIKEVTVFLSGAQILRTTGFTVPTGVSEIVFSGLSSEINPQSIQASGIGSFSILSVVHQVNYLKSTIKSERVLMLEDSLEMVQDQISIKQFELDVYFEEQDMLQMNKSIGGDSGLKIEDLKAAADFYRSRMLELKKKEFKMKKEIGELNKTKQRLQRQLGLENQKSSTPTAEVLVKIIADKPVKGKLEIKYIVRSAGWKPNYDVKVADIDEPLQLGYKAAVFQKSGEDWKDVKLTLSTGNPSESGMKPIMRPWYLGFHEFYSHSGAGRYNLYDKRMKQESATVYEIVEDDVAEFEAGSMANFISVRQAQTNVEFNINLPYSIPSDGKNHTVEIQKHNLEADFEYVSIPKIDKDAFLVAHVTGWEDYNLLSGEMNLFFEGNYIGKSYLDVRNTKDTLDLSLGRDKSIVVTRVRMKEFTDKKFIGTIKKETRAWQIAVRNTKNIPVKILIEDQVPVSIHEDIEIQILEKSKAKQVPDTGKLTWNVELKPGEEKLLTIKYEVKYPKSKKVILD